MLLVNLHPIFGSDFMTVEDRATVGVLVLPFRLCGWKVPPVCGLDVLDPLFKVNPFVLHQYIDVWTRGPSDSIQSFVVEVISIAYRSWANWDRVGGCWESLFRAWVAFVGGRKVDTRLGGALLVLSRRLLRMFRRPLSSSAMATLDGEGRWGTALW